MLPLSSALAHETGLSTEAGIPELWDSVVPVISGTDADTVCSFSPQYEPEGPVSVPGCCTSTFCYTDGAERLGYGLRLWTGLTGRDFGDPESVYVVVPQTELVDQSNIQGTFQLSHFLIRVLFKFGCIVFMFIAAFSVNALGLKVETLEKSLYVKSPPGIRVRIDQICRDCELEISRILLTADLRVKDISDFNDILGMDWLTAHRVVIDYDRRWVTAYTQDGIVLRLRGISMMLYPRPCTT